MSFLLLSSCVFMNVSAKNSNSFPPNSIKVSVNDGCGQVLTFTVSCDGCSYQDLAQAGANYIYSRTGSNGCFR